MEAYSRRAERKALVHKLAARSPSSPKSPKSPSSAVVAGAKAGGSVTQRYRYFSSQRAFVRLRLLISLHPLTTHPRTLAQPHFAYAPHPFTPLTFTPHLYTPRLYYPSPLHPPKVRRLTDLAEELRPLAEAERQPLLQPALSAMPLPPMTFFPLGQSSAQMLQALRGPTPRHRPPRHRARPYPNHDPDPDPSPIAPLGYGAAGAALRSARECCLPHQGAPYSL